VKEENLNNKFRMECQNMLNSIRELMKEHEQDYQPQLLSRPITVHETEVMKIYERRYFEAFIDPFVNDESDYRFEPSRHI